MVEDKGHTMAFNTNTSEIISAFLYNVLAKPANIVDGALIRPTGMDGKDVDITANWYMTDGPGRFAKASLSPLVAQFFEKDSSGIYKYAIPGRTTAYSKAEINNNLPSNTFQFAFQQHEFDDGKDNFSDRVYIWNSVGFSIAPSATFYVDPVTGERSIQNLIVQSVHTVDSNYNEDNFDFKSSNGVAILANLLQLGQDYIDPSLIGRKVTFNFTGAWPSSGSGPTYTYSDFQNDQASVNTSKSAYFGYTSYAAQAIVAANIKSGIVTFLEELKQHGPANFWDNEGRPILFGTINEDLLSPATVKSTTYFANIDTDNVGVVLVGGTGIDTIGGGKGNDRFYGGNGDDYFYGAPAGTMFSLFHQFNVSGEGDDIIHGGDVGASWKYDGIDTVDYSGASSAVQVQITNVGEAENGSPPIVVSGGSDIGTDYLYSIEHFLLTTLNDTVKFKGTGDLTFSNLQIDMAAGENTVDYTGITQGLNSVDGSHILNAQHYILSKFDDKLVVNKDEAKSIIDIDGGAGNDSITIEGGSGVTVYGGAGRDYIFNKTAGGITYGDTLDGIDHDSIVEIGGVVVYAKTIAQEEADGSDLDAQHHHKFADKFAYASSTTIMDAGHYDHLDFYGIPLTGGDTSGGITFQVSGGVLSGLLGTTIGSAQKYAPPNKSYYFAEFGEYGNAERNADCTLERRT